MRSIKSIEYEISRTSKNLDSILNLIRSQFNYYILIPKPINNYYPINIKYNVLDRKIEDLYNSIPEILSSKKTDNLKYNEELFIKYINNYSNSFNNNTNELDMIYLDNNKNSIYNNFIKNKSFDKNNSFIFNNNKIQENNTNYEKLSLNNIEFTHDYLIKLEDQFNLMSKNFKQKLNIEKIVKLFKTNNNTRNKIIEDELINIGNSSITSSTICKDFEIDASISNNINQNISEEKKLLKVKASQILKLLNKD